MSEFDQGIKVGDVIFAYQSGLHVVLEVRRRFITQSDIDRYSIYRNSKVGDELNSTIRYRRVYNADFNPVKGKAVLECDSLYCRKVDTDALISQYTQLLDKVKEVCEQIKGME